MDDLNTVDTINAIATMGILGWVACVVSLWVAIATRSSQGIPILPYDFRREPPWGMWDLLFVVVIVMGPQVAVAIHFQPTYDPDNPDLRVFKELLTWNAIVSACSIVGMLLYFQFRPHGSLADVGIDLRRFGKQLRGGLACFMLVAPIVFAIQATFVLVLKFESKHPLIELVQNDKSAFQLCAFMAVVVAPISEEILFRGLLQGWLERLSLFDAEFDAFLFGWRGTGDEDDQLYQESKQGKHPVAWLPIVISSAIFALMHWSHGPDPIPLFLLSLALGYVFQRTHSLIPCMIVHACLNGTTMLMLWLNLEHLPT